MRIAVLVAALVVPSSSFSADEWINPSKSRAVQVKSGSLSKETSNSGKTYWSVIARWSTKDDKGYKFFIESVSDEDCKKGYGARITKELSGKIFSTYEFVKGGGTVGSNLADFICDVSSRQDGDRKNDVVTEQWRDAIGAMMNSEAVRPGGIDYQSDPEKLKLLDSTVRSLGRDPKNREKSMNWFLGEANRIVRAAYGLEQ